MANKLASADHLRTTIVDRWRDRFQIEIGGRWQMMPDRNTSWRQWLFDPFFGLTRIGQDISDKPRQRIPEGVDLKVVLDRIDIGRDEATNLNIVKWISRVFWLRFGCRVLGLDIGVGLYFRKRFDLPSTTPAGGA